MGVLETVVAALTGLSILWRPLRWLLRRLRRPARDDKGVGQQITGNIDSSTVAGRDINVDGNLTIHASPASPEIANEWWTAEGAPRFRMNPNRELDPFRLSMSFQVTSDFQLNPTARWRGAGVDMGLVEPMRENRPNSYQMKAVSADPDVVSDAEVPASFVGFEIAFAWQGQTRHALWLFSLEQTEKGWRVAQTAEQVRTPGRTWSA